MNDLARRLPWRLAAVAGLVVGGVSLAGGIDPWICLERVGVSFAVFWLMGFGLRTLLETNKTPSKPPRAAKSPDRASTTGAARDQSASPKPGNDRSNSEETETTHSDTSP